MKSKKKKTCLFLCLFTTFIIILAILFFTLKSCNKQENEGKILVSISISSYQTTATLTINDDTSNIKTYSYLSGGLVGTLHLNQGDKIVINITNGDKPIMIYSYTTDTMPDVGDMTLEIGESWGNVPSLTYTLKMDDNIKGYYITITPEAV